MMVELVYSSMCTLILGSQFWFSSRMHFVHKERGKNGINYLFQILYFAHQLKNMFLSFFYLYGDLERQERRP